MTFWRSRFSIRDQLLWFAFILALPMAAMVAWLLTSEYQRAGTGAYAEARDVADNTAARLAQILQDHERLLSRIADRPLVQTMDGKQFHLLMADIMQIHPELNNLAVRDLEGNSIYSFRPNSISPQVVKGLPWFQEAEQTEGFVAGDAYVGRLSGRWVSMLTYPLRDKQGNLSGVINTPLDLLLLNERLFQHLPDHAVVSVVDRTGTILLRSLQPDQFIGKPGLAAMRQATQGPKNGYLSAIDPDGVDRLYTFVTLPNVDWRVVAGVPRERVYSSYRQTLQRTVLAALCVLLLTLALAWRLGIAIVRPIAGLAHSVARIAAGDNSVRPQPAGPIEIATVTRQINQMLDARERDQDALRHSAAFNSTVLNSVSSQIAVLDSDGVIVAVNAPWERFALDNGLEPSEVAAKAGIGTNYLRVCEPEANSEDAKVAAEACHGIEGVLSGHFPTFSLEYPCHAPTQERWFLMHVNPLQHHGSGVVVSHTDITQRRQAEVVLAHMKAIVDSSDDAIISKDLDGIIASWNAGAERLFGYSADDIVGSPMLRLIPPDRHAEEAHILHAIRQGERVQHFETVRMRKDGTLLDVSVTISPIRNPDGNLVGASKIVRDITERTKAEQQLRESEARYRELFESNPHPMWVYDRETLAFVAVNDAAVAHYGYSHAEFLAMTIRDIRPPEDVARLMDTVANGNAGVSKGSLWRHQRKDGSIILVEIASHPLVFDSRPARLVHAHDVTARQLAEEKLRMSEESLAITLQSIGDAVIATDTETRITRMNPTAERLTGWTQEEALGRLLIEVFRIVNAQTRAPAINPAQLALDRGEVVGLANHTALLARGDREYQIFDSAAPIRDRNNHVVGVVLVFSDATEAYRVRDALASTTALLERTGELAKVGGWELDLRTGQPYWSLETCRIHDIDPGQSPSLDAMWSYVPPESRTTMQAAISRCMERAEPFDLELPLITAKARSIWVRFQGVAVVEDGKLIKLHGAYHDITERKYAETSLQTSLREKEALLKEVHHRVKNNLQIINSLLRLEVGRSVQPDTRSVLRDMQGRIQAMALLHESLYRTGTFASVDLGAYLQQVANHTFRTLMPKSGSVRLATELESVQVSMDQATPCGLLINELISNCFKHGFPDGRRGEVRVALHTQTGSAQVRLSVSDTGVGLPSDFEVRRTQGLGLQLVSDLARQLGGALEVGPNSQFTVTFTPLAVLPSASPI